MFGFSIKHIHDHSWILGYSPNVCLIDHYHAEI